MSFEIIITQRFRRDIKGLTKKYPSLKEEFIKFVNELEENPQLGTSLGNNCFKVRISIASKGKGKSGGARIITYILMQENIVYLLSIYDKSSKENITDKELKEFLHQIY